jgi:hypothetical protein
MVCGSVMARRADVAGRATASSRPAVAARGNLRHRRLRREQRNWDDDNGGRDRHLIHDIH